MKPIYCIVVVQHEGAKHQTYYEGWLSSEGDFYTIQPSKEFIPDGVKFPLHQSWIVHVYPPQEESLIDDDAE